jgi:opacity protein-like surface antigen
MKKQLLCLCAIVGLSLALQAAAGEAKEGFYTRFDAGVAFTGDVEIKKIGDLSLPWTGTGQELLDLLENIDFPGLSAEDVNVEADYRIGKPKFSTDVGLRLDLDVGYRFNESWSVELELGMIYNSLKEMEMTITEDGVAETLKTGDLDTSLYQFPLLASIVYTLPLEGNLKPYLGAGAGGVLVMLEGDGVSESDVVFAWQVMAGVDYEINEKWSAGLAYKLLGTGGCDWNGVESDSFMTHSIVASVNFKF